MCVIISFCVVLYVQVQGINKYYVQMYGIYLVNHALKEKN